MKLLPAIDLLNGKVIRLTRGDYQAVTEYSSDPLQAALSLKQSGFSHLHLIDLSGARSGRPEHKPIIKQIIEAGLDVQVGGGIRSKADIEAYLNMGAHRVILGTKAIHDPDFWREMVSTFGKERLVLSLDLKDAAVVTHGWTHTSSHSHFQLLEAIGIEYIRHLIVTDVSRDGTLTGVNVPLYQSLRQQFPQVNLIPAGGFSSMADYRALYSIGCSEAVVGKAIHENPGLISQIQFETSITALIEEIDWKKIQNLLPAIIQSNKDNSILMLGYMNKEALRLTLQSGVVTFFSRTRQQLWTKGEKSGNPLTVKEVRLDCDKDALVIVVQHRDHICHEQTHSCFNKRRCY